MIFLTPLRLRQTLKSLKIFLALDLILSISMGKHRFKLLIVFLLSLLGLLQIAFAKQFPERSANLDVIVVEDTFVDLSMKESLIDHAKKTIDISAFILGKDAYGVTIVKALRRALERGVAVRMMYEGTVSQTAGKDLFLDAAKILIDERLHNRAQILSMGFNEKIKSPLAINDYVHEKFLIVDAGTPNEIIYTGGRDLSDFSRKTVDAGFILRPLNYQQPSITSDIIQYYNSVWNLLSLHFSLDIADSESVDKISDEIEMIQKDKIPTVDQRFLLYQITKILSTLPKHDDVLFPFQFRPETAKIVTNDLLETVIKNMMPSVKTIRSNLLYKDDIAFFIRELLARSSDVQLTSYTSDFTPVILGDLYQFMNHGHLHILTNGWDAMNELDPVGVSELSYEYSLRANRKFLSHPLAESNLKISVLDYNKSMKVSKDLLAYVHRKLALFDDQLVLTGSYNFTASSGTKNDEFVVLFKDSKMNSYLRELSSVEEKTLYKPHRSNPYEELYLIKNTLKRGLLKDFVKSQY